MHASSYKVFNQAATGAEAAKLKKTREVYRNALKAAPQNAEAMHVLGLVECQLGHISIAAEWLQKAVTLRPDAPDIQLHYGLVLMEQEKYAEAIDVFKLLAKLDSRNIEINRHLGNALYKARRLAQAAAAYMYTLTLMPTCVDTLNNLGNVFYDQGHLLQAIDYYRSVIGLKPDYIMAHNNMGRALAALGELKNAEACYRQALMLMPDYPEAHNNLGIILGLTDRLDDSKACYQKALALRPHYPNALNNYANALRDSGLLDEAIRHYKKALRLQEDANHRTNLAHALLAAGRFDEGWKEYEWRWKASQFSSADRGFIQPQWRGEAAVGRTLLIHSEQGFGDTLQFCRYAPLVAKRGMHVILEVQPELTRLLNSLKGVEKVIARGDALPDFDLHCPMLSLPLAFATRLETIPTDIPYLVVEADAAAKWRARMPDAKGALKVGLVWAGRSVHKQSLDLAATDRRRSIEPEIFVPLLSVPDVQFYSLQKGGPSAPASFGMIDYMQECGDFAETAALIGNLDLIISVDTAIVHLAGALGKPVWVLNRFDSCWRWLQEREDSAWYPSLRLFRQPSPGDWQTVIDRIEGGLEALVRHSGA